MAELRGARTAIFLVLGLLSLLPVAMAAFPESVGYQNRACGVGAFRHAFRLCQREVIHTTTAPVPLTLENCCLLALDAAKGCRQAAAPIEVCTLPDPNMRLLLVKSNCPAFCP